MKMDYTLAGDYYIPNLELPQESRPIGKWGRMHRRYLETYHPIRFNQLVLSGNFWTYLADINEQAQQRMDTLVKQMMASEGVTEELKDKNQMEWVRKIYCIHSQAEEVVLNELIYT